MSTSKYYNHDTKFFNPVKVMSPKEFADIMEELEMDDRMIAERLDLSVRQVQFYAKGFRVSQGQAIEVAIPAQIALLLRLMVRKGVMPKELN